MGNLKDSCKGLASPAVLLAALLLALGLLLPARSPAADTSDQTPNLAGTWKLNQNKSDNPRQKMQEAMGNSGNMQGGGGGGGYGRPRGQGAGGRGGMMNDFSQLTIVQNGSDIKVTGESGRTLAVLPADTGSSSDSSANSDNGGQFTPPPPTVHWQGTQLIAETDMRRGKTTRTYELSPDGKQLYVTTRMENPRFSQPVTYRFVYDPVKSN
jgi:hypothetical protein